MIVMTIRNMMQCLTSPRLYNIHGHGPVENLYQPRKAEVIGEIVITTASVFLDLSMYLSPFIVMYMYRRGMSFEDFHQLFSLFGGLSCITMISFLLRGLGRACNPEYMQFMRVLNRPKHNTTLYLQGVREYDFEFNAWPATFKTPHVPDTTLWDNQQEEFVAKENEHLPLYQKYIVKFLAYIAVNTFALRLIYPGSMGLVHYFLKTPLLLGRASLVEEHNGKRVKIITWDGNYIDTMFVDNRPADDKNGYVRGRVNGHTLVICSEGNSGFYEVGIMTTPLKASYSVLGWNHPGFAGSSGLPYPRQELAAMDAVLAYAVKELNFQRNRIVMYGWSIGGYSAAWGASIYHTRALVLDATFDDLLALAVKQMPAWWEPLVREVVRKYVDLNVEHVVNSYNGTVHLIRRTEDEIISLRVGDISSNRGNDLLVKLILYRHGREELCDKDLLIHYVQMPEAMRPNYSHYGIDEKSKRVLRLIEFYSSDFDSTHCVPLSEIKFATVIRKLLDTNQRILGN